MSTIEQPIEVDGDKLMQFVFRAVDEVGATLNAALVVMGDKLGCTGRSPARGGLSPAELAERTGAAERYVREWLNAQAAGGYVDYDPTAAATRCRRSRRSRSPTRQPRLPAGVLPDRARLGDRLAADHRGGPERRRLRLARARPRRPRGLRALLPPELQRPPRRRVAARARRRRRQARARGARRRRRLRPRRLDDPDGPGVPELDVRRLGLPRRLDRDRARSGPRRPASPIASRFEVEPAAAYSGTGYDLVTMFDCLHDMGDPVGAARHVQSTLTPDGTWMIVEPPPATASRTTSTRLAAPTTASRRCSARRRRCRRTSGSRSARRRARRGSATWSRRAASRASVARRETPFNLVFEARP